MRLTPPVSYDGENHACMQDIKSKAGPSLFTRLRESSRGATREPLLSVARPSTSMVHWQSGGEKWAECGGVSDWLVDDARKKKGRIQERDKVVHPLLPVVSGVWRTTCERAEGRRWDEQERLTSDAKTSVTSPRQNRAVSEWYLNHCLSVKRAGIVFR